MAHPILKKDMKLLDGVQHWSTAMVPGLSRIPYEERLKLMDLHSLAFRRIRGDAIETFKYLNGIYNVDCISLQSTQRNWNLYKRTYFKASEQIISKPNSI